MIAEEFKTEIISVSKLKPHPQNYKSHPEDQIEHLMESIREHGFYRPVAVAKDDTILAGHGVVLAAKKMKKKSLPVYRVDLDPNDPRALKLLTGDNEITNLANVDDRLLTEILKEIKNDDLDGLLGTGYTDQMLAGLVMVTRPKEEILDLDGAAEWIGLPDYERQEDKIQLVINFDSLDEKVEFVRVKMGKEVSKKIKSISWPLRELDDVNSVIFDG